MTIYKLAQPLTEYLSAQKNRGISIGFVPTMGALHEGHLSLISASRADNELTVCSIFVNPTQFNNPEDFKNYPITIGKDVEQLEKAGCDVLLLPGSAEIYPTGYQARHYELGKIETILEGFYRPGHFQGVCQVVDRLLQIVDPTRLYLGQKDYQQCMVIKKLLELTNRSTQLVIAPTVRELSGLAMSSRNMRLTEEEKVLATVIFQELSAIRNDLPLYSIEELKQRSMQQLEANGFNVDYVEIANANDLSPVHSRELPLVGLIAASLGPVRLIDNLLLN